jgi:hypothetical protein
MASDDIDARQAYAFLRVLAPKLAQLKQRLTAANEQLKSGGIDEGRLDALIEAQLALKEFLSGLADLNALVKPIDLVLDALREESAPPPPPVAPAPASRARIQAMPEDWLRVGTISAAQKLINAGMSVANAETYLVNAYATIGLTQRDGSPVSIEVVKTWLAPRMSGWRRKPAAGQKVGTLATPKGPGALLEAQARVNELSAIFKKMSSATTH